MDIGTATCVYSIHPTDIWGDVSNVAGIRTLWLRFSGGEGDLFDIDRFVFE